MQQLLCPPSQLVLVIDSLWFYYNILPYHYPADVFFMFSHLVAKNFFILYVKTPYKNSGIQQNTGALLFYTSVETHQRHRKFLLWLGGFEFFERRILIVRKARKVQKNDARTKIDKPYYSSSLRMLYAGDPSHCAGILTPSNTAAVGVTSTSRGNSAIS